MNTETQILATTILSIAEGVERYGYVSPVSFDTQKLIEDFRDENKIYEVVEGEDGEFEKKFVGFKDEKLEKILKHLSTSCEKDRMDLLRYGSEIDKRGKDKVELIKKVVKIYAIRMDEE
ncbi:hypothetical protein [Streptococcus sp. 20-1249]|uniref:hypothetical protein n=1 Tax=Streptococcus hepaticus TaxID=3349163 RepID=UPI003747C9BC